MSRSSRLLSPLVLALSIATLVGCGTHRPDNSRPLSTKADAGEALHLARLLRDNGRMAAAYGVYARADQRGQLDPGESLEYAQVSAAVLPAQDALPLFVSARQRLAGERLNDQQRFNLCMGIGRGQLATSQFVRAKESFECALQARQDSTEALNGLAIVSSAEGHDQQAEELLHKVLQLDPGNAPALNNLALGKIDQGQPQAAIDLLDGADLRGRPTLVLNLALAHLLLRDEDKAREALQRYMPRVRSEPLLAELTRNAQRILDGQPVPHELLAASRQALALDTLQ